MSKMFHISVLKSFLKSGMGRVCRLRLPATPAATASPTPRLGREGGQPGTHLLRQPQQQNYSVETAFQHVSLFSMSFNLTLVLEKRVSIFSSHLLTNHFSSSDVISETENDNQQRQIHQEAHRVFRSRRHISEDLENEHLESRDLDNVRAINTHICTSYLQ